MLAPTCLAFGNWHATSCSGPSVNWLQSSGIVVASANSAVIAGMAVVCAVALTLVLTYQAITSRNRYIVLMSSAVLGRCLPPIAYLVPHFVIYDYATRKIAALQISLLWIVSFHAFLIIPVSLLLIAPRIYRLDRGDGGEGGLRELAALDGISGPNYFIRILLPNSGSEVALAAAMGFSLSWGEMLYATVFRATRSEWTLPVLIGSFETSYSILWGPLFVATAVSLVAFCVVVVPFVLWLQRIMQADD